MTNTLTRDEKDDLAASRVEHIMETVGPKFEEDAETIEDVLEALLYAAHYVNTNANPGIGIFDTLAKLNKIVVKATVEREVEKLAPPEVEPEIEPEVEEEVSPGVSE